MGEPITKPRLEIVARNAVFEEAGLSSPVADKIAKAIVADPTIAPALKPVSRVKSEVLQGVAGIGVAQLLNAFGVTKSLVIAAGWFGETWNPDDVSTVATTVVSLGLAAWAWYGRETTTRPLA